MASNFYADVDKKFKSLDLSSETFPMIRDHRTEMYVKFAKVMIIFQGPVNETTNNLVKALADKFKHACRIISDKTYQKETNRLFTPDKTEDFHRHFKTRARKSCEEGYNLIVIYSSISNSSQLKYYFFLAQRFQYVIIPVPHILGDTYAKHSSIRTQVNSFDNIKLTNLFEHKFCGWFLHDVDSTELREEASLYARDCFEIPEFADMFSKVCDADTFKEHYNLEDIKQDLACCIVKILTNDIDAKDYMSDSNFLKFYGGMSKLYIVGFIISPHMIAARVKLTHDQKPLWMMPDDLNETAQPENHPSELRNLAHVTMPSESVTLLSSKCNRTLITGKINYEPIKVIPPNSRGRSCNIVLGNVKKAPKRNVDYDVHFAVFRERSMVPKYSDNMLPYDLSRCVVRRIGKYWFIYLKETIIVNGLFATCCSPRPGVV